MSNVIAEPEKSELELSLQGGQRPTGKDNQMAVLPEAALPSSSPEPEVKPTKPRRVFSAKYKLNILDELDRCITTGGKGAILRREGLYTSQTTDWKKQRNEGLLSALNNVRGRKNTKDKKDLKITLLEEEIKWLKTKLLQAETIIDVQKKVCEIFGISNLSRLENESSL